MTNLNTSELTAHFDSWTQKICESFEFDDTSNISADVANKTLKMRYECEGNSFELSIDLNDMLITEHDSDPEDNTNIHTSHYKITNLDEVEDLIGYIANVMFWGNSEGEEFLKQHEIK